MAQDPVPTQDFSNLLEGWTEQYAAVDPEETVQEDPPEPSPTTQWIPVDPEDPEETVQENPTEPRPATQWISVDPEDPEEMVPEDPDDPEDSPAKADPCPVCLATPPVVAATPCHIW